MGWRKIHKKVSNSTWQLGVDSKEKQQPRVTARLLAEVTLCIQQRMQEEKERL